MRVQVACLGGGVDSTAMIIEMVRRERVDLAIFSDTGDEKPHTYDHLWRFAGWLEAKGVPLVIVRYSQAGRQSLYENCEHNADLPSRVYGYGTCAYDWKLRPMWKELKRRYSEPVTRSVGFTVDDGRDRPESDEKGHVVRYPLTEWGMDRAACRAVIRAEGMPVPEKSACFYCPSSKPAEVTALRDQYPDLYARALALEAKALGPDGRAKHVAGLGRSWSWRSVEGQGTLALPIVPDCGVCIT